MKSVLQNEKQCFVCGTTKGLEAHHCIHGTANRKIADKYGYTVYLCRRHHTAGRDSVHQDAQFDLALKRLAQRHFEREHGTRQDFIGEFGKSWL